MDKFVIRGGNPLLGTVRVSGAKNAALPAMAAALLTEEPVILENIPQVRDIETERKLLAAMGAEVELGFGRAPSHHYLLPRSSHAGSTLRNCKDDAGLLARSWPAARPLQVRPCLSAWRLRHRRPPNRPSYQRTRAPRGECRAGTWIH